MRRTEEPSYPKATADPNPKATAEVASLEELPKEQVQALIH